jgi:Fuc2NAc and GlcNAc transferase
VNLHYFAGFVLSFLVSASLQFILMPVLRRRLLDLPNARSSHNLPTPRGGGIVFVSLTLIACLLEFFKFGADFSALSRLTLLVFPLAFIGFLDDYHGLSAGLRYIFQLATAVLILLISPLTYVWFVFPFLVIAITAVINFTNFMDGLDGLVAGCMVVIIFSFAIHLSAPFSIWVLIGTMLGFLVWNWCPASVFMGDVGSTFLGAIFAGLVLQVSNWPEALGCLLVATPLLGDASLCLIRRVLRGQPIFFAHRLHLYQRLHQAGWHHHHVSLTYIVATGSLALAFLFGGLIWVLVFTALVLVLGIWLDQRVAVPFCLSFSS